MQFERADARPFIECLPHLIRQLIPEREKKTRKKCEKVSGVLKKGLDTNSADTVTRHWQISRRIRASRFKRYRIASTISLQL